MERVSSYDIPSYSKICLYNYSKSFQDIKMILSFNKRVDNKGFSLGQY